jgi:DnaJ-class molecular chaperone
MSKIHTHYDNLKIARNAPDALIKAAYKLLLQQHHPDKVEVAKQAEALRITHIIRGSYDVLSDPVQRAEHDAWIKTQEAQSRSHKPEQPDINVNEAREKEEFRRRETEKAEAEKQRQAHEKEFITQKQYEAVLGEKNRLYYLLKFQQFDQQPIGLKSSWNWSAFLFNSVWVIYRKMYAWFFAFLGIVAIVNVF